MRRFLVILLAILTPAAPALCCCTLLHVVRQVDAVPSCCHAPAEHEPAPCKDQCPCLEHRDRPVALLEAATLDLPASAGDFVAWVLVVPIPGVAASLEAFNLPPPFLSAERLLHVHHRLRC